MKNNQYPILFLLLAVLTYTGMAQSRLFFSMSVVDRPDHETKISSYVTTLDKNVACLQLVSGIYAYYGITGNKLFTLNCPTGPVLVRPEIKLFPNPAINYIRAQSTQLLTDHPSLLFRIIDASGRTIMQQTVSNNQLYAGQSLFVGMLASGSYFLKIEGASLKQIIPFIKVN
jgi:hypothetical protein